MSRRDTAYGREQSVADARSYKWRKKLPCAPDNRRCIPVRLTEVPLTIRLDAARAVCHDEPESERPAILAAALMPSDDIHWIAA